MRCPETKFWTGSMSRKADLRMIELRYLRFEEAALTGDATEIGRIGQMLASVESVETPLLKQMAVFGRWLTVGILLLAGLTLAFGMIVYGQPASDMFLAAVGLAVAAIPEQTDIARVALLCNDATLREVDGMWQLEGAPTEGACGRQLRFHRLCR